MKEKMGSQNLLQCIYRVVHVISYPGIDYFSVFLGHVCEVLHYQIHTS